MTDEHYQEVTAYKEQLKTSEKENKELLSRIKRQEDYIEQQVSKARHKSTFSTAETQTEEVVLIEKEEK